ncbi:hypothetical protein O6H91_10G081300 [Diphasiastrum complanatum]|nr:hypothetical protein O6H91_10G081300 [Diphasiastrum complanatum]KAJ7541896.1 hypothetical protein O6H91_10G081300 [Diphasiastrum complanatum]
MTELHQPQEPGTSSQGDLSHGLPGIGLHSGHSRSPRLFPCLSDGMILQASQMDQWKSLDMKMKYVSNSAGVVHSGGVSAEDFQTSRFREKSLSENNQLAPLASMQLGYTPAFHGETSSMLMSSAIQTMPLGSVGSSATVGFPNVFQFKIGPANYTRMSELPRAVLQQQINAKLAVTDSELVSRHGNTGSLTSADYSSYSNKVGNLFVNARLCYPASENSGGFDTSSSGDAANCSLEMNSSRASRIQTWNRSNSTSSINSTGSSTTFTQELKQQIENNISYRSSQNLEVSEPPCTDDELIKHSDGAAGGVDNINWSELLTAASSMPEKLPEQLPSSAGSNSMGWQLLQDLGSCGQSHPEISLFAEMQFIASQFDQML